MKHLCCYCQHIFKSKEKHAQCPKCGQQLPTEPLEHWIKRVSKQKKEKTLPEDLFDNLTRETSQKQQRLKEVIE